MTLVKSQVEKLSKGGETKSSGVIPELLPLLADESRAGTPDAIG
jgi:hypothetical protein